MLTENNRILPSEAGVKKPNWLAYPEWLKADDPGLSMIYSDIVSMREHYVLFASVENPVAQSSMANWLMTQLNHLETSVYNRYDYSASALGYAQSQVERLNTEWLTRLDGLTDHMAAEDFGIKAEIKEGSPVTLIGGYDLQAMHRGYLMEDFLYKHPAARNAFYRWSTLLLKQEMAQRVEALKTDILNTTTSEE